MSIQEADGIRVHRNPRAAPSAEAYGSARAAILNRAGFDAAEEEIGSWPGHAETPLHRLPGLAARLGVAALHYKDEGSRFGLQSFKALGGAYAVFRLLQRTIEARTDVLVYTTPVLERDVEVTGPVTLTLFAATSAVDTDFTGKLVDVHPDGFARNLTDGILRARYRESRARGTLLKPSEVYEYTIDLWATSNVFKAGHRIRLEIASSNFPRFDRNPQTGEQSREATRLEPALQHVFHDELRPSHVVLPLIPR